MSLTLSTLQTTYGLKTNSEKVVITIDDFITYLGKRLSTKLGSSIISAKDCSNIFWNFITDGDKLKNKTDYGYPIIEYGYPITIKNALDICNKFLDQIGKKDKHLNTVNDKIRDSQQVVNYETAINIADQLFGNVNKGIIGKMGSPARVIYTNEIGDLFDGEEYYYVEVNKGVSCNFVACGGGGGGCGVAGGATSGKDKTIELTNNNIGYDPEDHKDEDGALRYSTASSVTIDDIQIISSSGGGRGVPSGNAKQKKTVSGDGFLHPSNQINGINASPKSLSSKLLYPGNRIKLVRGCGGDGGQSIGKYGGGGITVEVAANYNKPSDGDHRQHGGQGGGRWVPDEYYSFLDTAREDFDETVNDPSANLWEYTTGSNILKMSDGSKPPQCRYGLIGQGGGGNTITPPGCGGLGGSGYVDADVYENECDKGSSSGAVSGASGGGGGYVHGRLTEKALFINFLITWLK